MGGHFSPYTRWISSKLWLLIGLAVLVLSLGAPPMRAAGGSKDPESPELSAGGFHTCWLKADGSILCWGSNYYGEVSPVPDNAPGTFTIVSGGDFHTCALKTDGSVACWGRNNYGQVSPVPDNGPGVFSQVSAGEYHSCGLKMDGSAVCWGSNVYGQVSPVPGNGPGAFSQVSAGEDHTCGLKMDGSLVCWGSNDSGQVSPVPGNGPGAFAQVSVGEEHTCGLLIDGSVVCWGDNTSGQVSPVPGNGPGAFAQVSAGDDHTCGLKTDYSVVCWGRNYYGQVSPVPGNGPGVYSQVSAGDIHSCGLKLNGRVACWGNNGSGQCNLQPVAVAGSDQNVFTEAMVSLDGRNSYDPDNLFPLAYSWQQTGGPAVSFSPGLSLTTFTAPSATTVLTFTLTVTDAPGLSGIPDEVVIFVQWPDLQISQESLPVYLAPAQPVTYTLSFSNIGTDDAFDVVLTDTIPAVAITGLAYTSSGAAITNTGYIPQYVWQVDDLAPGEGGVITITGILSPNLQATLSLSNTAAISTISEDLTTANNSLWAGLTILVTDTPPVLTNNTGLTVAAETTALITPDMLRVTDAENVSEAITFTLQTAPDHGTLRRNGAALEAGEAFSQQDIDLGNISYTQDGSLASRDSFVYQATDGHDPTERVSVSSSGAQAPFGSGDFYSISADGRYVAFTSDSLVEGDTNNAPDIYVHDRLTRQTSLVSVSSEGIQANDDSLSPVISPDGRLVAFISTATNLVADDTNGVQDIFVHDRQTGETWRASVSSEGGQGNDDSGLIIPASLSATGRYVAFESFASNLVDDDLNLSSDIFVHDNLTGETTRASVSSTGMGGDLSSHGQSISADGRYVAFGSYDAHMVPGDTNSVEDIFVHDRLTGETTRVSVSSSGDQGNAASGLPAISGDGRYVAFYSEASNLVSGDTNGVIDIFRHDRWTGQTERVSLNSAGGQANGDSYRVAITPDGRYVTFTSAATNLAEGDTNNVPDIYLRDLWTGQTSLASIGSEGQQSNQDIYGISVISADGRYVGFETRSANLVPGDTNGWLDVFVRDRGFITGTFPITISFSDLAVTKSVTPDVAAPGQTITYTLAFSNTGDDLAAGVVITDILPVELSEASYQISPGLLVTDTGYTPSYVWQVQDLAPGQGGAITVTAVISPGLNDTDTITNTVIIGMLAGDTDPSDNSSFATSMVGYPLADSPWPHHRGDLAQTGRSPYVGPTHPQVKWAFTASDAFSSPAIGVDRTIYAGLTYGKFYAINPDGSLKWSFSLNEAIFGAPAIAADGTIYFGTNGSMLYALNLDGSFKWWFYASSDIIFGSPTIGPDGVIYFASLDDLYALNPDGTQRWIYPGIGGISSPAISPDGTIYIGNNGLHAIRPDGSMKWVFTTGDSSSPAIGADGTIYVGSADHNLYAVNPDGNLKWSYTTGDQIAMSSPAIGTDGMIFIGSMDGKVYAIYPDGSLKWSFYTGVNYLTSSPVIGGDGTVYAYGVDGFYAINPDGTQKWVMPSSCCSWDPSPAIGKDGTIYLGGAWDNTLYAIGGTSDVQLSKSVSAASVAPGDPVTYTLAFAAAGDGPFTGVVLTDIVPTELTSYSYQVSPGLIVTDTGQSPAYIWQVQDLAPGEGGVITLTGVLANGLRGGSVITNTAAITSTAFETNTLNNTSTVTLTVLQVPPELAFIPNKGINELSTLTFTATATDLNGDALTFSLASGPAGASLTPEGLFTWTPGEGQGPGVYSATIQVEDNGTPPLSDSQAFVITVNEINTSPVVTVGPDLSIEEGSSFVRDGSFTDPDNVQTWTATVDYGDGSGAQVLALNPDKTFLLDHSYGDDGIYTVIVTVSDDSASGQDFLQVTTVNISPTLSELPDQAVLVGQIFTVTGVITDPGWLDTHTVTIAWAEGVTETIDLAAGEVGFDFTHTYADPGPYTVTITVTDDDGGQSSRTVTITVLPVNRRVYLPVIWK